MAKATRKKPVRTKPTVLTSVSDMVAAGANAAVESVRQLIGPLFTRVDERLGDHDTRLGDVEAVLKDPTLPDDLVKQIVRENKGSWDKLIKGK